MSLYSASVRRIADFRRPACDFDRLDFSLGLAAFAAKGRDGKSLEPGECTVSREAQSLQGGTADTWAARISTIGPSQLRLSSTSFPRPRETRRASITEAATRFVLVGSTTNATALVKSSSGRLISRGPREDRGISGDRFEQL